MDASSHPQGSATWSCPGHPKEALGCRMALFLCICTARPGGSWTQSWLREAGSSPFMEHMPRPGPRLTLFHLLLTEGILSILQVGVLRA